MINDILPFTQLFRHIGIPNSKLRSKSDRFWIGPYGIKTPRNDLKRSTLTSNKSKQSNFAKKKKLFCLKHVKKAFFWESGKKNTLLRVSQSIAMDEIRVRDVIYKRWNFRKNPSTGSMIYTGGADFLRPQKRSKMPFLTVLGHFWPFWAISNWFKLQQIKCLHKRKKIGKKNEEKKSHFWPFWQFFAVFGCFVHFGKLYSW